MPIRSPQFIFDDFEHVFSTGYNVTQQTLPVQNQGNDVPNRRNGSLFFNRTEAATRGVL